MLDAKKLPAYPLPGSIQGAEFVFSADPMHQGATLWDSYFSAVMTGILAGEHTRGRKASVDKAAQMAFPSMLAEYGADIADAMAETRRQRFGEKN